MQLPGHALSVAGCGAGQKHQSKFADLHLVAVRQHRPVHGFTVDVRAVEAADVDNLEFAAYAPELGVPAADSDVIEEDIAIRVTTGRRGGPVEQEPRAGVRAALDHQQPRALRQRLRTEQLALGAGGGRRVLRVAEVGTKRRGPLPGDVVSPLVTCRYRSSAAPTPTCDIATGEVERVTEFDEHVQRHHQLLRSAHHTAWAVIRPLLRRTLATTAPKMNPPTWAKNATPLSPVLEGWISA